MRRLYFLVPTIDSASQIVDELLLARVDERHIHIAAKDHHALHDAHLQRPISCRKVTLFLR